MVQGLAFLSKKSWHTKNLANQEKVWMAEQRKDVETQKTKELAKQIQQEREQEELEKISGKKGPKLDRGIDWMYQGNTGEIAKEDAERKAEEFLLGKEYVADGATQGDFDDGDQNQGINSVLKKQEEPVVTNAFANEPSVKDRNEDFRLRVEDPMFLVSQKQREKVVQHDKTKALYERVVGYQEEDANNDNHDKKNNKASKKEKKRHKKHRKTKSSRRAREHYDESDDNSSIDYSSHRHHRSLNVDQHRSKRYKRSSSYDRRHSSRSYDTDESHHDRRRRHQNSGDNDQSSRRGGHDREEKSLHKGKRSNQKYRSDSEGHHEDSRRAQEQPHDDRRNKHDDRDSKRHRDDRYRDERDRRTGRHHDDDQHPSKLQIPDRREKKVGYGLKGASVTIDPNDLGPSRDLLQKKREEREAERRKIKETASSRRQRTEEERVKALDEMQANARKREESRYHGHKIHDNDHNAEPQKGDASFLKDITRQTHGMGEDGQTLSSRVAQNRHTNQRLHDSFL